MLSCFPLPRLPVLRPRFAAPPPRLPAVCSRLGAWERPADAEPLVLPMGWARWSWCRCSIARTSHSLSKRACSATLMPVSRSASADGTPVSAVAGCTVHATSPQVTPVLSAGSDGTVLHPVSEGSAKACCFCTAASCRAAACCVVSGPAASNLPGPASLCCCAARPCCDLSARHSSCW